MMKRFSTFFILLLLTMHSFAQIPGNRSTAIPSDSPDGALKGIIFDTGSNQPMEYASIALFSVKDSSLITGAVSATDGSFTLKPIKYGKYYAVVNFIGFKKHTINNILISPNKKTVDLGVIKLSASGHTLQGVTVTSTQNQVQYQLDKKVVNVGQDINSRNGTAIEALQNIPSVNVDTDGNLTLRGSSSFTVLIDGRPSVLDGSDALKQIPATSIDRIEVITNPSAKYDPSGDAGIINVILKKNVSLGLNGVINATVGTHNKYRSDATINYSVGKFNLTFSANYAHMQDVAHINSLRQNTINDTIKTVDKIGAFHRQPLTRTFKAGFDYKMSDKDVLSLMSSFGMNQFGHTMTSRDTTYYTPSKAGKLALDDNESLTKTNFYGLDLNWQHKFNDKGHELDALLFYSYRDGKTTNFQTETILNALDPTGQNTDSYQTAPSKRFRAKLDYTLPFDNGDKFEAGYQAQLNSENDGYLLYNITGSGQEVLNDQFSSNATYNEDIHAAYATYSGKRNKFQYELGLRGEYDYRKIADQHTATPYTINRLDLFPTLHISEDFTPTLQALASYTRRVNRPRNWQLNSFQSYVDPDNIRVGNPGLKPEFVDSYEFSVIKRMNTSFISLEAYYRINHNLITNIMSPNSQGIFVNTFDNLNNSYTFGAELMSTTDLTKWLRTTLSADLYNYKLHGSVIGDVVDKNSTNYNFRLNTEVKLAQDTKLQLIGTYRGPSVMAQGDSKETYGLDMALQQNFLKQKLSAVLQMTNILGTMNFDFRTSGQNFYTHNKFSMETRGITLTLSYKLNNFKSDKKKTEEDLGSSDSEQQQAQ